LVRRVLLRRVPGAMLPDRVDLVEPFEHSPHPGNALSTRQPTSGKSATTANPTCHDDAATSAPKSPGYAAPGPFRSVCCRPIADPLRPWPASSTAAANDRLFQLIDSTPATTSTGTSTGSGASRSSVMSARKKNAARAIARRGLSLLARRSDQRPAP